jgi:DNA-binding MarR family transcriptional regulator
MPHEGGDAASAAAEELRAKVQRLGDAQQRLERYLASRLDVDHSGLMVMKALLAFGPQTPTELARRLDLSPAAVSSVLNRLEAAGHASRSRHPSDGRKLVVTASDSSTAAALHLIEPFVAGIARLSADLSPSERGVVQTFLDDLCALHHQVAGGDGRGALPTAADLAPGHQG